MNPIGTKTVAGPDHPDSRVADGNVIGGVRWLGMSGDVAAAETPADRTRPARNSSMIVLGSAHGPRLLELIRAAC